jgi:hypothetical protein
MSGIGSKDTINGYDNAQVLGAAKKDIEEHARKTTGVHGLPGTIVEDTATNGHDTIGISSNWAFDHNASLTAHVGTGATFPGSPTTGQQFLHTPTGRVILLQYDGSIWRPIISYGDITFYVDHTNGTDDMSHGYGTTTSAFKHVQYALDYISGIAGIGDTTPSVMVNVAAGTYGEDLYLRAGSKMSITVNASTWTEVSKTATGGAQGTTTTAARVTGTFTDNQYDNLLCWFTSGTNNSQVYPIGLTTTTNLYLVGQGLPANPANGDTYKVIDWTVIESSFHGDGSVADISFIGIKFTGTGTPYSSCICYGFETRTQLLYCNITTGTYNGFNPDRCYGYFNNGVIQLTANNYIKGVNAGAASNPDVFNTRIVGSGSNNYGIISTYQAYIAIRGCEISGCNNAVQGNMGGVVDFWSANVSTFAHGNGYGLYLYQHSQAVRTVPNTNIVYGAKLDGTADVNTTADTYVDTLSGAWNESSAPILTQDHTWAGCTYSFTAGTNLTIGQACYVGSDGKMELIDADAAATMPCVAMATTTIAENTTGAFLLLGAFRDDSWNWTVGGTLYGSTDPGALTHTAPSGTTDIIQVIGKALTADIILFNPSLATATVT